MSFNPQADAYPFCSPSSLPQGVATTSPSRILPKGSAPAAANLHQYPGLALF